jgi:PAS domain S-box-containing protein
MNFAREAILLDHSSGILLLVDPSTLAMCEASWPTLRLLGYRREALLGRPITDIECGLVDAAFWTQVLEGGPVEVRNAESSYRCANGEILSAIRTVSRVSGDGKGWLVVRAEPLDSAHRIGDELAAAVSLLQAALEATADGILLTDRAGGIMNMNQRFARMWGLPDELLLEREDRAIFGFVARQLSDPEAYLAESARIAPDSEGETFDILHLADGRLFERKSMPARHRAKILGRVFSFTDVTARKRAEDALRINEEQFRRAFDVSPDAININRIGDGLYVSVNSGFTRLTGYTKEEIVGHTSGEFNIWENIEDRERLVQGLKKTGTVKDLEAKFRVKSGEIRTGLMYSALIEIDGVPHSINIARDITDQKQAELARAQLEMQLRESQKMEALGTLAGGIAHDFNNIVAAIMGNAELARLDLGPAHKAQESLGEILKASRRAKELVQQILAFGRRQLLERQVISLAPAVEESARLLRTTLPPGVRLIVNCAPDAPAVLADSTQIEQVLLNLCSNAWQAMQKQKHPGVIEVSLNAHVVAEGTYRGPEQRSKGGRVALRPGRYARLMVRDNGPGMDEATRGRIFEPFFTTKPAGEGTGLGLAVVHGIVQGHEGSIEAQSAPGQGASFYIYFPEATGSAPGAVAHTPAPSAAYGEGKHILWVDDDESIVFLMTRLLERQGYRVSGYTDPHEALAAIRADPDQFALAVTDYNMPGMSGIEVARTLRRIRADLPVVLASGFITGELRAEASAAGIIELIYKPNTAEDLCKTIARVAHAQRGKGNSA